MRITDGTHIIEITLHIWDGANKSPDFSNDFFDAGGLSYDFYFDAYRVEDINYCIGRAEDWSHKRGDFHTENDAGEEERLIFIKDYSSSL